MTKIIVVVVADEITDVVPVSHFIVHCRWRSSGWSRDDIHGYIVTVECRQNDATSDSTKSCSPLLDVLTLAVERLNKCLSTAGVKKCPGIESIKAFVRSDCFSAADLSQGYYYSSFLLVLDHYCAADKGVVVVKFGAWLQLLA